MSEGRRLTRADGRPKAPVRIVHLGLGNFFRAHTCWYTEHALDADRWGIAAFSGRTATHVAELRAQDELYTLMIQGPAPSAEIVSALTAVHTADDLASWRDYFTRPEVGLVTSSITEGGYLRDAAGDLDLAAVASDVAALREDPLTGVVTTAPGKFVAGLLARRAAGAGPITFVPCDNVVSSGAMVKTVVTQMACRNSEPPNILLQLRRPMKLDPSRMKERFVNEYHIAVRKGYMIPMVMRNAGAMIRYGRIRSRRGFLA